MWRPDRRLNPLSPAAALLALCTLAPAHAAEAYSTTKAAAMPSAAAPASAASTATPSASAASSDAFKDRLTALPSAADLRPKGPVQITADRTDAVEGMTAIYSGHVNLDSDTLHLDGDRLELKQHADHAFEARVTGGPAHMSHTGTGPDNPPMAAHAKTLNYDSTSVDRSLQAAGGKQQVRIVIQPPPGTPGTESPAPAAPAPASSQPAVPAAGSTTTKKAAAAPAAGKKH
jgi:hypothetical protein